MKRQLTGLAAPIAVIMWTCAPPSEKGTDLIGTPLELADDLPMPFGRAEGELVEVDEDGNALADASTRSATCVKTLCIQRDVPSPAPGEGKFYVYHRDADNTGWSALLTEISWYDDLPALGAWASFTLYDEQSLPICINEEDVVFVLEHHTAGTSPFGIRVTICENGLPMLQHADQFVLGGHNQYMWGMFDPADKEYCTQGADKSQCGNINFSAIGDGPGTVRFFAPRSNVFVDLPVTSQAHLTWPRGPVVGMWHNNAHNLVRGTGGYTRNCNNTSNDYAIAGNTGWHGVILNVRSIGAFSIIDQIN